MAVVSTANRVGLAKDVLNTKQMERWVWADVIINATIVFGAVAFTVVRATIMMDVCIILAWMRVRATTVHRKLCGAPCMKQKCLLFMWRYLNLHRAKYKMTSRCVWYFCKQEFTPRGWSATNEMVCYRMADSDPRIMNWTKEWQTKGLIFGGHPQRDPATELAYLNSQIRYMRIGKLTVEDAPKDDTPLK